MNPETNDCIDLIDLGVASVETQGHLLTDVDFGIAGQPTGLSDDD